WLEQGLTIDDTIQVVKWLDGHGEDLIDVSSGANLPAKIPTGPGYQVPFAEAIRRQTNVPTGAVSLITEPIQAEHILMTQQADVVQVGCESLRNLKFTSHNVLVMRYKNQAVPVQYD